MPSALQTFLNHEVEIRFPLYASNAEDKKGDGVGKVYHGVISQITDQEVIILAPYKNDFTERDGNSIKVKVMAEEKSILNFTSITLKNFIHDDGENQVFVIKYPSNIKHSSRRAKPRVNTKIPSRLNIYSLKGKVYPLRIRRTNYKTFVLDISEGGTQIASNKKFPCGLRITLSILYSNDSELQLDGDLVWQKHDRGLYRYGVKFVNPSIDEKYILRHIINNTTQNIVS